MYSQFGHKITSLPALDGDGTDLVVAAPADSAVIAIHDPTDSRPIVWPPPSGTDERWAVQAEPPGTLVGFCGTAVTRGTFSLDASADPVAGLAVTCSGSAYVFNQDTWSGSERRLSIIGTEISGVYTGFGLDTLTDEGFGASVARGDFNDDGIDDVAVGSDTGFCDDGSCGAVYVFMGPHESSLELGDADFVVYGDVELDHLGHSLLGPGDLTGDGTDDLLMATNRGVIGGDDVAGAVLLFSGESMEELAYLSVGYAFEDDAYAVIHGVQPGSWFGAAMGAVPDVDGDGLSELVIGAPNADGPASDDGAKHGAVYGFMSPWTPGSRTIESETRALHGSQPDATLGLSIAVGDIGANGVVDIAVAEPNESTVYVLPAAEWLLD